MNKKKILTTLAVAVGVLAGVSLLGAYEAHVINVKARIENALAVSPLEIDFGTVFPQEYLTYNFDVKLSESFLEEGRVDDIRYVIKQKPKPKATEYLSYCEDNAVADGGSYPTWIEDPKDEYYTKCYPDLGWYLSKQKDPAEIEEWSDVGVKAFRDPKIVSASGYLSKKADDIVDRWVIDLPVPCFGELGDQCAQDWPTFFAGHDGVGDAWNWTIPKSLEHMVFGSDLWIEVTSISVNYVDRVDIGTPASEDLHDAQGWGPIETNTHGGYWGNIDNDLNSPDRKLRVVYASSDNDDTASFNLDFGMDSNVKLVLRILDGSQDDDFAVYVGETKVYSYDGTGGGEAWVMHEVDLESYGWTSLQTITIEAPCPEGTDKCSEEGWFDVWGHVGVDYAMVVRN
mgnify:CR=1 FL=1